MLRVRNINKGTMIKNSYFINSLDTSNIFLHLMANLKGKDRVKKNLQFKEAHNLNFILFLLSLQRSSIN